MFEKIVVAIDVNELDQLDRSLAVAKKNLSPSGRLTMLHVLEPISKHFASQLTTSDHQEAMRGAQAAVGEIIKSRQLPTGTIARVDSGSVYRKIIEHAGRGRHQAIVIASHTPRFGDILLGSVAAQVVKHASCSVFVVRSSQ